MKIPYIGLASAALLAGVGVAAYKLLAPKRAEEDSKEPQSGVRKSTDRGIAEPVKTAFEEFKEAAEIQLKGADSVLSSFKHKLSEVDKDVADSYEKIVDELEKRGRKMKKSLEGMKEDGKEKWEDIKHAFTEEFSAYNDELRGLAIHQAKA